MEQSFFKQVEKKTGVSFEELMTLAQAIQYADFTDERQVRKIVRKVGKLAKKPVSPELENKIVESILKDGRSLSFDSIEKML